jgi:hypothetical protein
MYNPPAKPSRPFEADYPQGARADASGRLTHDIEGRPLTAEYVVGRRTLGETDEAVTPTQLDAITEALTGNLPQAVASRQIGGDAGQFTVSFDAQGNPLYNVLVDRVLLGASKDRVSAHEAGHAIDYFAGRTRGIPQSGLNAELRQVYNTLNSGRERTRSLTGPQHLGYRGGDVNRELMAEAIRAYMTDPNYIKTVAPNVAARIRERVNAHPELSRIIQFNSLGAGLFAPLTFPLAGAGQRSEPPTQ